MSGKGTESRGNRRQQAREAAQAARAAAKKRERRNRVFIQGGIGVVLAAIVVVVILVIVNTNGPKGVQTAAGPKNMITDGIVFTGVDGKATPTTSAAVKPSATPSPVATTNTDGTASTVEYIDWACPVCKNFEAAYGDKVTDLVASGKTTLAIHPVSILDRNYRSSRYASRAANAAACVANYAPDKFLAVQTEFYDNQPSEGTNGLNNTQIKRLIRDGGVNDSKVSACVDAETFKSWVSAATQRVLANPALVNSTSGSFGTPTVVVNGKLWNGSDDLTSLISQ